MRYDLTAPCPGCPFLTVVDHRCVGARIVILDDDADMGVLLPFLVRTDYRVGLTDADAARAAELLEGTFVPETPS